MNPADKIYIAGHRGLVGSALMRRLSLPSPASGGGAGGEGRFSPEQAHWLETIRDHIAANLGIGPDDYKHAPFVQAGGRARRTHFSATN